MEWKNALAVRSIAGLLASALVIFAVLPAEPARSSADEDSNRFFASLGRPDWGSGGFNASAARQSRSQRRGHSGKRVASLGADGFGFEQPSLTGGGQVVWSASSSCLNSQLASVVSEVAANFGRVRVNSTCRSRRHNARAGGARHSHHLAGNAVDFRIWGNVRAAHAFLRSHSAVGAVKHYGGGLFHIDTGSSRRW